MTDMKLISLLAELLESGAETDELVELAMLDFRTRDYAEWLVAAACERQRTIFADDEQIAA